MRYVQLRAFHHVATTGGFSLAAEALHLTQPAISDQVRSLEIEYDVRLFNREKKKISLSASGEKLFEITRQMFEIENQALEFLSESQAIKSGRLSIVADSTFHITAILKHFRNVYPQIFISVTGGNTKTVVRQLNSYEADIGVGAVSELPDGREFDVIKLGSTPIVAFTAARGKFGKLKSITMHELAELPLVMREPGSKTRSKFEELAKKMKINPSVHIEAEGREAVRDIVASSDGIGIVSEAEFGGDPRFVKIPITDASLTMDEAIISLNKRKENRPIRAFMQVARDVMET